MHPILFRIPFPGWELPLLGKITSIPIYSYGVMLGLSIVVGWYLTLGLAKRDGLPQEEMANNYVFTALMAILGSRVLYVVTNPDEFKSLADIFALRRGGLVAYGGFLGGFLGSWLYLKRKKLPLLPWADVAVPSLATGLMITRVGCYLFGCDYGKRLSDTAPGVLKRLGTFPHWPEGTLDKGTGSPAWVAHVERHLVAGDASSSLPVHPTQIYESLVGLSLFALVMLQRKHQKFRGQVFLLFTFAYGFCRYSLEILRDDAERGEYGPQMAEHLLVPGGLLLLGLAYIFFIARAIELKPLRLATQAVALLPALGLFLALRPPGFAEQVLVRLSTSQWVALLTGLAAAFAYNTFSDAAKAHPERAMALELPGDEAPAAEEEAPRPKKRKKKKAKAEATPEATPEAAPEASTDESPADEGEKLKPA
ncbi:MAG: prolipoprotein diacylglyceryl transferase [Polyangiaceae bacterium]|jgi:phosphatidylglycerol:prolipoprotein diacylglycerol transferase|nr:prolipoprotein diacylglyceryl transferase [Polyangiaceae bacterium]